MTIRLLLALTMAAVVGLSVLSIRMFEREVHAYHKIEPAGTSWAAADAELRLAELLLALERHAAAAPASDTAGVARALVALRDAAAALEPSVAAAALTAALARHGDVLARLARDPGAAPAVAADFDRLAPGLRLAAEQARTIRSAQQAEMRRYHRDESVLTLVAWAITVLLGVLVVVAALVDGRRSRRAVADMARLADEAQAAVGEKSRFLTMMSHELRTPMNGVMGLIALVKQSGLTERQRRLIEHAERSGNEMVGLMRDMLDFGDLQGRKETLEHAPFATDLLVSSLCEMMADRARRRRVAFEAAADPAAPRFVMGDMPRLRQALAHFCTHFVEFADAEMVRVMLTYADARLLGDVDVVARDGAGPDWRPGHVFGRDGAAGAGFASDAVGPMIGRGLVQLMDGTLSLDRPAPHRARLCVAIPAPVAATSLSRDSVRVETSSDTTALMVHAALDEARWQIWAPGDAGADVAAVLVEVAGEETAERIVGMRAMHPAARLIALGEPDEPAFFDAVCRGPVTRPILAEALDGQGEPVRRAVG